MVLSKVTVVIDVADPEASAGFWEQALGYRRRPSAGDSPYVSIERAGDVDGPPEVTFQRVPEPKEGKVRVHLDLFVDHALPLVSDLTTAGATLVTVQEAGEWTTRVLQDPDGTEFCIVGPD